MSGTARKMWNEEPRVLFVEGYSDLTFYAEVLEQVGLHPDKVRIGAVLSVLNEDDPRLGPGARNRRFDFGAAPFAPLLQFLRGMA